MACIFQHVVNILSICVFKNTDELFSLIENIKTIERLDKVTWSEEVRSITSEVGRIAAFGFDISYVKIQE